MEYLSKTVAAIPLNQLWDSNGFLEALRIRHVSPDEIDQLLSGGSVQFVIAAIGEPLRWIDESALSEFWNNDAKFRIVFPDEEIFLDDYPDAYCYVASEWSPYAAGALILLEKYC